MTQTQLSIWSEQNSLRSKRVHGSYWFYAVFKRQFLSMNKNGLYSTCQQFSQVTKWLFLYKKSLVISYLTEMPMVWVSQHQCIISYNIIFFNLFLIVEIHKVTIISKVKNGLSSMKLDHFVWALARSFECFVVPVGCLLICLAVIC